MKIRVSYSGFVGELLESYWGVIGELLGITLDPHMPVLKKKYRGPFNLRLLFREPSNIEKHQILDDLWDQTSN